MTALIHFAVPGRLAELSDTHRGLWSDTIAGVVARCQSKFPQFYDPTLGATPDSLTPVHIVWGASPARILREESPGVGRLTRADGTRDEQDEYCEWSITRDADNKITRITFTTEVPEYWEHIALNDRNLLLKLYHEHVDSRVTLGHLFKDGQYLRRNRWNTSTQGRLAHLVQDSNTLQAAIQLVAEATILRQRADGTPITDRQELVVCGGLGNPFRSSDPQIVEVVNDAATVGDEVTLLDPFGLYLDGLQSAGMQTPDGTDAADFWHLERGTPEHVVRASFAVPDDLGYTVSDIKIGGQPIVFGAQVADKVRIRISALARSANHQSERRPCET